MDYYSSQVLDAIYSDTINGYKSIILRIHAERIELLNKDIKDIAYLINKYNDDDDISRDLYSIYNEKTNQLNNLLNIYYQIKNKLEYEYF